MISGKRGLGATKAGPEDAAPVKATLVYPYGFIDGNGTHRFWKAGSSVETKEDLDLLRLRGVILEED